MQIGEAQTDIHVQESDLASKHAPARILSRSIGPEKGCYWASHPPLRENEDRIVSIESDMFGDQRYPSVQVSNEDPVLPRDPWGSKKHTPSTFQPNLPDGLRLPT